MVKIDRELTETQNQELERLVPAVYKSFAEAKRDIVRRGIELLHAEKGIKPIQIKL